MGFKKNLLCIPNGKPVFESKYLTADVTPGGGATTDVPDLCFNITPGKWYRLSVTAQLRSDVSGACSFSYYDGSNATGTILLQLLHQVDPTGGGLAKQVSSSSVKLFQAKTSRLTATFVNNTTNQQLNGGAHLTFAFLEDLS